MKDEWVVKCVLIVNGYFKRSLNLVMAEIVSSHLVYHTLLKIH